MMHSFKNTKGICCRRCWCCGGQPWMNECMYVWETWLVSNVVTAPPVTNSRLAVKALNIQIEVGSYREKLCSPLINDKVLSVFIVNKRTWPDLWLRLHAAWRQWLSCGLSLANCGIDPLNWSPSQGLCQCSVLSSKKQKYSVILSDLMSLKINKHEMIIGINFSPVIALMSCHVVKINLEESKGLCVLFDLLFSSEDILYPKGQLHFLIFCQKVHRCQSFFWRIWSFFTATFETLASTIISFVLVTLSSRWLLSHRVKRLTT